MSDNPHPADNPPVAADALESLNGAATTGDVNGVKPVLQSVGLALHVSDGVAVHVNDTNPVPVKTGAAGDSPPPLAANATGLLGYVRKLVDMGLSKLVQLGTSASGSEYTSILAGLNAGGIVRAASIDDLGRIATRDASDTFGAPVTMDRVDIGAGSTAIVNAQADRRYIEIQNTHASDNLIVFFGATAASAILGDVIGPLQSWDGAYNGAIQGFCPTGAKTAMVSRKIW